MPATLRHPVSLRTIQYLINPSQERRKAENRMHGGRHLANSTNTIDDYRCYPSTDSHAAHNFKHSVVCVCLCPDQGGLGPTERAPEQSFCSTTLAALHLPRPPLWPDGVGGQLRSTPSRTRLDDALDPSRQDKTGSSLRYRLRTRPQS